MRDQQSEPAQQPVPKRELRQFLLVQDTAWLTGELLRAALDDLLLHGYHYGRRHVIS